MTAIPTRIPPVKKRGGKTVSAAAASAAARVAPRARRVAPSMPDRLPGEGNVDELISERIKAAEQRAAHRRDAEKRKTTARDKRMHAVQNGNVHDSNESARQVETRSIDRESERSVSWTRPSALDAPPPRPGMKQRWIRYRTPDGKEDTDNLDKALDQGWCPVARSRRARVHELTADSGGKFGQYIVKRGQILMEISAQTVLERNRFYRNKQLRMNQGIDEDLFQLDNRYMPMQRPERRTRVAMRARRGRLEVPGDEADA